MIQWKKKNKVKGSIITFFRAGCEFQTIEQEAKKYTSLFEKSMYIFVVCQAFKDRLIAYGYPEQKIIVHHSAINTNNFPYYARTLKDKEIKILTIGRLHPMKGHSYSIQAIKMLSDLGYNITYNIYGEGKEHNALLKLIKELKLENTVYLKNYCSHKDVVNLLHNHHIFLLTSCTTQTGSQEGIPNVLMEAMATGMPIVSTWHSGIPELITDKKNGLLVPEYDSQATAEALLELITHSTDWPKLATEARKYVLNEHNTKKQTEKVLQLFYKIKNSKIGEK
ncbi:glycosyltransferase [bacterium]|nr:MAG: glycosyltransferase [bacterium]